MHNNIWNKIKNLKPYLSEVIPEPLLWLLKDKEILGFITLGPYVPLHPSCHFSSLCKEIFSEVILRGWMAQFSIFVS